MWRIVEKAASSTRTTYFYYSSNIPVNKVVSKLHSWNLYTNTLFAYFCTNTWLLTLKSFLLRHSLLTMCISSAGDRPEFEFEKCRYRWTPRASVASRLSFYSLSLVSTHFDSKRKWKGMREENWEALGLLARRHIDFVSPEFGPGVHRSWIVCTVEKPPNAGLPQSLCKKLNLSPSM